MKERIRWIDIAKCFGIFAIYLGHLGVTVGRSYYFVFTHHVALFFFISGCMEVYQKEERFLPYFIKKIKTIMVPFWVFAGLSGIITILYGEFSWEWTKALAAEVLRGVVRNTYPAGSLWFLTCLFVMQLMFFWIRKLRYKGIIFAVSVLSYYIANYVLVPSPAAQPSMYYNADSALYYMIFYGIGYLAFPYIKELFELNTLKKKLLFSGVALVSIGYTTSVFFGLDVFAALRSIAWCVDIIAVVSPCIMIMAYLVIARVIEDANTLAELGRNTLYLCGSEHLIRVLFVEVLAVFGLTATASNPINGYIYTGILLFIANKYLVPIEKYIIQKIVR